MEALSINNLLIKEYFYHHFQPVLNIQDGQILGYECLFRTYSDQPPDSVFMKAKKQKKLYELDSRSIHKALKTYNNAGSKIKDKKLFLNIFPSTIMNQMFYSFISIIINENKKISQQIVLEINENERINDFHLLKKKLFLLKKLGIQIAIDDIGNGFSSIKSIIDLDPDFIKLDKYFLGNLHCSERKKDMIEYLVHYCNKFNCHLIVEGIEDLVTLSTLKDLGVQYAQGYLLGMPSLL
ncbi:EAL domain-containing protein [Bacillus sp. 03113]|uniref:EAL domain-containing protein n=1 Tax=Bacillus sp. 03113 TaxID=2578211 RepID=UPI001144010E|nr:EAL domain-containing protein [Bacillus sp. 03113]